MSQSVCPWNVKFSQALAAGSTFAAREFVATKDAVTLARDILTLDQVFVVTAVIAQTMAIVSDQSPPMRAQAPHYVR